MEELYSILYKNEQYRWLACWLICKFDWGSENVYFRVREDLKKMIVNKNFNGDVEGAKYAFMKLETCLSYNNN